MQWLQQAVKTSLSICPELRVEKCCFKKLEGMSAAIVPKINIAFPPKSGPDKYKNNNNVTFDFFPFIFLFVIIFVKVSGVCFLVIMYVRQGYGLKKFIENRDFC